MDPTSIYGLRRPNLEVELSASTPAEEKSVSDPGVGGTAITHLSEVARIVRTVVLLQIQ
jgi:hypothetical protein